MVGAAGFEPTTTCAQGRCATRLRYAPCGKRAYYTISAAASKWHAAETVSDNAPRNYLRRAAWAAARRAIGTRYGEQLT